MTTTTDADNDSTEIAKNGQVNQRWLKQTTLDNKSNEWNFVQKIWTEIHNPNGLNVTVEHTFEAIPEFDGLTSNPKHIHQTTSYHLDDELILDESRTYQPVFDVSDVDRQVIKNSVQEAADLDPAVVMDKINEVEN
jgi:hypothetical protein